MAEKRYFWLKLQHDFFSSKRIKKLRKLAGGDTFTIIYLKMQLLSLKTEGVITFTGLEKSFAEELALDIDEEAENVALTLSYLMSCELIETSDNIDFFLPYVADNIGSETSSAKRVREFRERQESLHCNAHVTAVKQNCNGEIDIEIDKEIDKEIEKDIEKSKRKDSEKKHKYGEYHHVLLTDSEHEKLVNKFGEYDTELLIAYLDASIEEHGYKYKSHYLTISKENSWVQREVFKLRHESGGIDWSKI